MIKQRIFALILALAATAIFLQTRFEAQRDGRYFLKAAAFAPLGIVTGIFLVFFPKYFSKQETVREKAVVMTIFAVGILLGLYNWYSIDPSIFKF
jgi:hypothetical protein